MLSNWWKCRPWRGVLRAEINPTSHLRGDLPLMEGIFKVMVKFRVNPNPSPNPSLYSTLTTICLHNVSTIIWIPYYAEKF